MVARNLRVAMHNILALAPYERPDNRGGPLIEWLVVERSGADGERLTISDAGSAPSTAPADAPSGLTPNNTMYGLLLHENEIGDDAVFLLARHLPAGVTVEGSFFPADGYARLSSYCFGLQLRAAGRHAHDGAGQDIPDPAPGEGLSWHFDAKRVRWVNESYVRTFRFFYCFWYWICPWHWYWYWFWRRPLLRVPVNLNQDLLTPELDWRQLSKVTKK